MEHFEHNLGDHEDPIPASTWLVGAVGAVLLLVIIFGLTALYYNAQMAEEDEKIIRTAPFELGRYQDRQAKHFVEEPVWVERDSGDRRIRALVIPLEDAMEDVIREYGQ